MGQKSTDIVVTTSYDSGNKRNWSSRVCNTIQRHAQMRQWRLGDKKISDKTVLYLCEQNIDGYNLESRGFSRRNLFPVNKNKKICDALKADGWSAKRGDFNLFLMTWRNPLDYIIADFCGGLNYSAVRFMESCLLSKGVHSGTLAVLNLLHGRDKESNEYRASQSEMGGDKEHFAHRGRSWLHIYAETLAARELKIASRIMGVDATNKIFHEVVNKFQQGSFVDAWSYKSPSGLWMDTLIFKPGVPSPSIRNNSGWRNYNYFKGTTDAAIEKIQKQLTP